jgi:hypothetical protein
MNVLIHYRPEAGSSNSDIGWSHESHPFHDRNKVRTGQHLRKHNRPPATTGGRKGDGVTNIGQNLYTARTKMRLYPPLENFKTTASDELTTALNKLTLTEDNGATVTNTDNHARDSSPLIIGEATEGGEPNTPQLLSNLQDTSAKSSSSSGQMINNPPRRGRNGRRRKLGKILKTKSEDQAGNPTSFGTDSQPLN